MGLMVQASLRQLQDIQLQLHQEGDEISSRHSSASDVSASAADSPTLGDRSEPVDLSGTPLWNWTIGRATSWAAWLSILPAYLWINCELDKICISLLYELLWIVCIVQLVLCSSRSVSCMHLFDCNLRMQKFYCDLFYDIWVLTLFKSSHYCLFIYFYWRWFMCWWMDRFYILCTCVTVVMCNPVAWQWNMLCVNKMYGHNGHHDMRPSLQL